MYNPFLDAERPTNQGKTTKKKIRILTPFEIRSFLEAVEKPVNQEAACRLEDTIFQTGHNLVTIDKKEVTVKTVTP